MFGWCSMGTFNDPWLMYLLFQWTCSMANCWIARLIETSPFKRPRFQLYPWSYTAYGCIWMNMVAYPYWFGPKGRIPQKNPCWYFLPWNYILKKSMLVFWCGCICSLGSKYHVGSLILYYIYIHMVVSYLQILIVRISGQFCLVQGRSFAWRRLETTWVAGPWKF